MSERPVLTEEEINNLLHLAGASSPDKTASAWLREALGAAPAFNRASKGRPVSADHNDLLADVAKTARELIKQFQRLRRQPYSWYAFWRSVEPATGRTFDRRAVSEAELKQAHGPTRAARLGDREVLSTLNAIVGAARTAKDPRKGRPRDVGKQHVVDLAFAFFVRYSPLQPSGTPTGPFATFARAFYAAAMKLDPDDEVGLDRQIREAIKRLPIHRERARHMSTSYRKK